MSKEYYPINPFAQGLLETFLLSHFQDRYRIVPIVNDRIAKHIDSTIRHLDKLAKTKPEDGFATVFEGLAFDDSRVRSQAIAIYDQSTSLPAAISSFIIAPAKWVEGKRYFEPKGDGVFIRDFTTVANHRSLPKFLFFPGWTYVDPAYRIQFAIPGFRAIKRAMTYIKSLAPNDTWAEEIPRGTWPRKREQETLALASRPVGTFIPRKELPFELSRLGQNSFGSSSSVKIAKHLELNRISNLSSVNTLGPVFASQLA